MEDKVVIITDEMKEELSNNMDPAEMEGDTHG